MFQRVVYTVNHKKEPYTFVRRKQTSGYKLVKLGSFTAGSVVVSD